MNTDIFKSKKFWGMVGAVVTAVGIAATGGQPWAAAGLEIAGLVSAWLIGQGIADNGKEAVKEQNK